MFQKFPSGYWTNRCTVTDLLKVVNDPILSTDSNSVFVLILYLRAAFDTINHDNWIHGFQKWVGPSSGTWVHFLWVQGILWPGCLFLFYFLHTRRVHFQKQIKAILTMTHRHQEITVLANECCIFCINLL